jgi:hypothetical protein
MHENRDAMMVVRAELVERLERLRGLSGRAAARDFEVRLEGIRAFAAGYGLKPVARIAEAMQQAAVRPDHCSSLYFELLGDAIGCERADENAVQAMLASISIRLGV